MKKGLPDDADQLFNDRCWIKAIIGVDLESAKADCDFALRLKPGDIDTLNGHAFVLYRQSKYKEALEDLDQLITAHKSFVPALFLRGLVKLTLGDETGGGIDIKDARKNDSNVDLLYAGYGIKVQ